MKQPVDRQKFSGDPRVVLAGGAGFIGRNLTSELTAASYEVVVLSRRPDRRAGEVRTVQWDGANAGAWAAELDGAVAVVNLAGHTINCPHTEENRRLIRESRINSVRAVVAAVRQCAHPPPVLVQASAVGFYGNTGDAWCDEKSSCGQGFLAETCREWEAAAVSSALPRTRVVRLRIGVVLGRGGGALQPLASMTRWGLGGAAGDGRQFMSWIHQSDLRRIVLRAIQEPQWDGVFNAVAPNPATNADFMRELRRALHRPWVPPAPRWAVRIGCRLMGTDASLALEGQRVKPKRLLDAGFEFWFSNLSDTLGDIFGR